MSKFRNRLIFKDIEDKTIVLIPEVPFWTKIDSQDKRFLSKMVEDDAPSYDESFLSENLKGIISNLNKCDEELEPVISRYMNSPTKTAYIEITNQCNLQCVYCYSNFDQNGHSFMDADSFRKILSELSQNNIKSLILSGGEPFLNKEIYKFIDISNDFGFVPLIITNGTTDLSLIIEYLKKGKCNLKFSIDSINEKTHDSLRGNNAYRRLFNNLSLIFQSGLTNKLSVAVTIVNQSVSDLIEILDLYNQFSIKNYEYTVAHINGRLMDNTELLSGNYEDYLFEVFSQLISKQIKSSGAVNIKSNYVSVPINSLIWGGCRVTYGCSACKTIKIDIDGNVFPCPFFTDSLQILGNIDKTPLNQILSEEKSVVIMNKIFTRVFDNQKCAKCDWRKYCGGGCMAMNLTLENEQFSSDSRDYHCNLIDRIYKSIINNWLG